MIDLLGQFLNTYQEWHYFLGGISLGFVIGWVCSRLFLLANEHLRASGAE